MAVQTKILSAIEMIYAEYNVFVYNQWDNIVKFPLAHWKVCTIISIADNVFVLTAMYRYTRRFEVSASWGLNWLKSMCDSLSMPSCSHDFSPNNPGARCTIRGFANICVLLSMVIAFCSPWITLYKDWFFAVKEAKIHFPLFSLGCSLLKLGGRAEMMSPP